LIDALVTPQMHAGCCNGWVIAISTASAPRSWRSSPAKTSSPGEDL
jgi:hypothetical protein